MAVDPAGRAHHDGSDAAVVVDAIPAKSARRSDEIDYELFGEEMQYVEVTLDPGEMVIVIGVAV